jgi:hypothetical protein
VLNDRESGFTKMKKLKMPSPKIDKTQRNLNKKIGKRNAKTIFDLEGKVRLSYSVDESLNQRRKDIPHSNLTD